MGLNEGDKIKYLSVQDVIEFNVLALSLIKTKKADKSEVLSFQKIQDIIDGCNETEGDIYDKAVFLLKNAIKNTHLQVETEGRLLLLLNIFCF